MTRDNPLSRRTALKLTGAAAATALVAGCGSDDGDENGNGDDSGDGGVEIDPDTEITFSGQQSGWEGLSPDEIDGEQNPTLILQEGETYNIGWTEGDDIEHNFEIRDSDDEVVDDYETDVTAEPDEDQILEIEVTSEMANYVCQPHDGSMRGEIQVE